MHISKFKKEIIESLEKFELDWLNHDSKDEFPYEMPEEEWLENFLIWWELTESEANENT